MNISGPQFLLFYAVLALLANFWLRRHYRSREAGEQRIPRLEFSEDPYRIACLRAGEDEAIRLAAFSLIDRGLLLLNETARTLHTGRADANELARRPLEKSILAAAGNSMAVSLDELLANSQVRSAADDYRLDLAGRGLVADSEIFSARFPALTLALFVTLGVALARIAQALAHGRSNIFFLIILTGICAIALWAAYRRRITGLGAATLAKFETLFASLKRQSGRIISGGQNNEAALLAAVFGLSALPSDHFPYVKRLFPKTKSSGDGGGDSGGDGGGDSGGCGGGCGGCG